MATVKHGSVRGHLFVDCQLSNPTWCDNCGDFIWGLSKQCQKCSNCHYTCHSHCVASVSLDCTVVSPGSGDGPVASPTDFPSSKGSDETALTSVITQTSFRQPQRSSSPISNSSSQAVSQRQGVQQLPPPGGARRCSSPLENASSSSSIKSDLLQSASSCTLPATTALSCGDSSDGVSSAGGRDGEDTSDAANEKDETDSGYRSGTIPDEKLPKAPSQATLNRRELQRKIQAFNHFVPKAKLEMMEDGISSQGFIWVTLNLVRPITMELGARPPSIYELLTREHIIEQSTQHIAFYMPRDTVKSMHITSKTTTREVITGLLKKFHILDNPRKFAMYEQEFNDKNKLVKLRRLTDKDFPLLALLSWEPERIKYYRLVLQENETGEIVWNAFSTPELKNFLVVLDREEGEAIAQLQYKYRVMKRIISQRMKELRNTPAHESKA